MNVSVPILDRSFVTYPGQYRPFSYFVLGGTDLSGESLALNGDAMFDTDEEIDSGVGVDASCDPRISKFDIAEAAGISAFEKVQQEAEGKGLKSAGSTSVEGAGAE